MLKRKESFVKLLSLSLFISLSGCTDLTGLLADLLNEDTVNSSTPFPSSSSQPTSTTNTGKVQTGEFQNPQTSTIGNLGGTVAVSETGSPINGMTIEVPSGSYADSRKFEVSYAPIKDNSFGSKINPITPLIRIKNGGGYSKEVMTIKIPIKKSSDEFAMAFYYDETTGKLEGIPVVDEDNNSITLETRHFSSSAFSTKAFGVKGLEQGFSTLIVSSISESILTKTPIISTGYKPGVDDWDFQNNGSFITDAGHCAGQSIASIWYYYEKKLEGSPSLHSLYDKEDSLWFDNPKGYKFASVLQKLYEDMNSHEAQNKQYELATNYSGLAWKAFVVSMLVTGEPQMVGIRRFKPDGSVAGGHALVAYKVDYVGGKLYIVDPNWDSVANAERTIDYDGTKFKPYTSSEKVGAVGRTYTLISYRSKTSYIDYYGIGEKFNQISNNTIGNDVFPSTEFRIINADGTKTPLKDDFISSQKKIKVECFATPKTGNPGITQIGVYRGSNELISDVSNGEIELQSGDNLLGFWSYIGTKIEPNWIDFKYLNIKLQDLAIIPSPMTGEPNKPYTWKVQTGLPKNTIFEWTFGDGQDQTTIGDGEAKNTYKTEGTFTINVKAKDPSNNKIIGEASAIADIKIPVTYKKLSAYFRAVEMDPLFIQTSSGTNSVIKALGGVNYRGETITPLTWNGNSFSVSFDDSNSSSKRLGITLTRNMQGTVDFDKNILLNLTTSSVTAMDGVVQSKEGFSAKNVPLKKREELYGSTWQFDSTGNEDDLSKYVSLSSIDLGSGTPPKSVNWSNARLQIIFN